MANQTRSIGLIGFGQIGSYIYDQVVSKPELGLSIAFVYDADRSRTESLPRRVVLDRLEGFGSRNADMICEVAHPDVTRDHGLRFLAQADYFPLSVTALADRDLAAALERSAVALAGIGFERTRSVLIADPTLRALIQEIRLRGGGVEFEFKLLAQMTGVTGSATPRSVVSSIVSTVKKEPGLHFC